MNVAFCVSINKIINDFCEICNQNLALRSFFTILLEWKQYILYLRQGLAKRFAANFFVSTAEESSPSLAAMYTKLCPTIFHTIPKATVKERIFLARISFVIWNGIFLH